MKPEDELRGLIMLIPNLTDQRSARAALQALLAQRPEPDKP